MMSTLLTEKPDLLRNIDPEVVMDMMGLEE
jgi:hypothetical protein